MLQTLLHYYSHINLPSSQVSQGVYFWCLSWERADNRSKVRELRGDCKGGQPLP